MSSKMINEKSISVKLDVFNNIMNGLKANVYVTDIDSDEIIFMNQSMKDVFSVQNPEGKKCWEILQKNKEEHCEFCPVERLKKNNDINKVYKWDEINSVTKKEYQNYDCLLEWIDGRIVHFQQSIDVTEIKQANIDELTKFYSRKYGKDKLEELVSLSNGSNKEFTICLYDINLLKEVNDNFGHLAGDDLIKRISDRVVESLNEDEFAFRLSGDEFVIVYACKLNESQKRIKEVLARIETNNGEAAFCYGFAEYLPEVPVSASELLFLADKRMYEQKRQYHIEHNQRLLDINSNKTPKFFEYDEVKLYDALVESTDDYIFVSNMKTGVFKYSKSMVEEFNLPGQIIANAPAEWGARVHPEDKASFLEANQEIIDGRSVAHCIEYRAINRKNEWVWVRCRGHLILDDYGKPLLFAGFITNLGKKNKIDNLTGLFNKLEFKERLELLIKDQQPFATMLLGIDDLKHINDLYDRSFGDEVIRAVSHKIQSQLDRQTSIYRLDGDVFGIISIDASLSDMQKLYRTIFHRFAGQKELSDRKYYCSLSGGCVFHPLDADNYEDLIKYANYCLEFSKENGKKKCTYLSSTILDERARSLALIEELRESVENDFRGFRLVYQPLVDAKSKKIIGTEALARWSTKQFEDVSPMEFIPLLESTGLIVEVGKWALTTALKTTKHWIEKNPDFKLNVNLSYIQIQDKDFLNILSNILKQESFNTKNLVLEVTENYFIEVNDKVHNIFKQIRDMGIKIAMDDFGTGYSTLGVLKEAPVDIVKIDKTFIKDIGNSIFDVTFIRFVVELCHNVNIEVCLEGVETESTYNAISTMGLDYLQGYLFDRPLEADAFASKYIYKG